MSDRPRARVLSVVVAALAAAAAMAPSAAAKGLDLSLSADPQRPSVGRQVEIALRGAADPEVTRPCRAMRVVVVAPGVSVKRALRSLEGRADSRRIGRWAPSAWPRCDPWGSCDGRGRSGRIGPAAGRSWCRTGAPWAT